MTTVYVPSLKHVFKHLVIRVFQARFCSSAPLWRDSLSFAVHQGLDAVREFNLDSLATVSTVVIRENRLLRDVSLRKVHSAVDIRIGVRYVSSLCLYGPKLLIFRVDLSGKSCLSKCWHG